MDKTAQADDANKASKDGFSQVLERRFWFEPWMDKAVASGTKGVAEVLFPRNDYHAPDWQDAHMVSRMVDYVRSLPGEQRFLLTLMFFAVQWGVPIIGMLRLPPFSKHADEARIACIRGMRSSPWFFWRWFGDSLKAVMTMVYLSHPKVEHYLVAPKLAAMEHRAPASLKIVDAGVGGER